MISCGIDFGTSNSSVAISTGQGIKLVPIEDGSPVIPSAIFFPTAGPTLFGRAATRAFFTGEEGRYMRSLKRILGSSLMDQGTVVNGKLKKFDEIIGSFLSSMKSKAEAEAGVSIDHAVIGRPVHFHDYDPAADTLAQEQMARTARKTGFRHIEFQYEPIAAAFAHEIHLTSEKLALVIDIGGGTSDFTVIRLCKNNLKKMDRTDDILGNSGTRLGGNDLDKSLSLVAFMPSLGYKTTYGEKRLEVPLSWFHEMSEWSKVNFLYTPRLKSEINAVLQESQAPRELGRYAKVIKTETGHRLLSAVEQSKIDLTEQEATDAKIDFVEQGLSIGINRPQFEESIAEHIEKISATISDCLALAEVQQNQIELIVLTGGPTETPLIKHLIRDTFPAAAVSEEDKLSSVALGLGYDSQRRFF